MPSSRYGLGDLSPAGVRALITARCWDDLRKFHHEISRDVHSHHGSSRRATPKSFIATASAQLLEFVRTPLVLDKPRGPSLVWPPQYQAWCDLSERLRPLQAAAIARAWAADKRPDIRRVGARMLAALCTKAEVPAVLRLLSSEDDTTAQETIWGVWTAIEAGHSAPPVERRLVAALRDIASGKTRHRGPDHIAARSAAAHALLKAPGHDGLAFLCSPAVISTRNPALRESLLEVSFWVQDGGTSRRTALRSHLDAADLWRIYDAWIRGDTIRSRTRHHFGTYDDQIAGITLHLAAIVDPARAKTELLALKSRRPRVRGIAESHFDDAEQVLSRPGRRGG